MELPHLRYSDRRAFKLYLDRANKLSNDEKNINTADFNGVFVRL